MAISVDWGTGVITVPKLDLALVQSTPVEVRQLDLNDFRLAIANLQDGSEGIVYSTVVDHSPPVSVGGVELARVVQILDPYTVTFEDGQYAVNLVGANSNLADKVNVNQVSVRASNSAGLVTSQAIEYGEYGGGVTVDEVNGGSGTVYPWGTERRPVNNFQDAVTIAGFRGLTKIFIKGNATIPSGVICDDFVIIGQGKVLSIITIEAAASVLNCKFTEATVQGTLDGFSSLYRCTTLDINFVSGSLDSCTLDGVITLGGSVSALILNCESGIDYGTGAPTINCGGSGQPLAVRRYSGELKLTNKTGTDQVDMDIHGSLELDSTVTGSNIFIRGQGQLVDNSSSNPNILYFELIENTNNASAKIINDVPTRQDMTDYIEQL